MVLGFGIGVRAGVVELAAAGSACWRSGLGSD